METEDEKIENDIEKIRAYLIEYWTPDVIKSIELIERPTKGHTIYRYLSIIERAGETIKIETEKYWSWYMKEPIEGPFYDFKVIEKKKV